ncbi:hypothetical protein MPDQ_001841 [Monascus purpureus]|uniref:Major facilitator superfamily (MFS) profile domain-containing protein n=1 Tax=Monascus purpureus TaxID=5098 RepID=A0A507QPB1_MONPU|nr:hypothetical protein MPDQ_001841 [Monascus purpureus]
MSEQNQPTQNKHNDPESLTQQAQTIPQEIFFITLVCSAQLMTQAGLALSITPLHIIGDSFHITSTNNAGTLTWSPAAYSLTVGTFILISGRLGDLYGHKLLFLIGWIWFGLWSLLAGFSAWSPGIIFFDFCRAMQGIGPALLNPNALAILARTYPPGPRKNMVFSLFGATAPGGFTVGSVFSALLAERVWWPWAYWVMGIACFLLAALGAVVVPQYSEDGDPGEEVTSSFARIDVLGAVTGIAALVLINFAWNQGPVVGWTVPYTYILLIVGFLSLGLFMFVERRAACPLIPPSVFKGDVGWVLGCIAAGWSSFGILVYYFFQVMEVLKGNSPLLVTAKWAGVSVSGAVAAIINGFLLGLIPPSIIIFIAMLAFTAGQLLLATLPLHQIFWAQAFVLTIVTPWGM